MGKVHAGFLGAYNSVRGILRDVLMETATEGWQLYTTGHSLGAALAMMGAVEIGAEIGRELVSCYTAG